MSDNDQIHPSRKSPWQTHYEAGLAAAHSGNVDCALEQYTLVLERRGFIRALPGFVDNVLLLGDCGQSLIRKYRNLWEDQIREGSRTHYTIANIKLFNASLQEPERDIHFYEELRSNLSTKDAALLICLGALIIRLGESGHTYKAMLYAADFAEQLESLVTNSERIEASKAIKALLPDIRIAFIRTIVQGDPNLVSRAVQSLLFYCPQPTIYFELKLLAEAHGEVIQIPLNKAFNRITLADKLRIIISESLIDSDPEGFVALGAPLDEYAGEAEAVLATLQPETTVDGLTDNLYRIWKIKFGRYRQFKDGKLSEPPIDVPNYKPPDLTEAARKIYEAILPYLDSLPF